MRSFKYGSRVIENERQVRLEQNVRNIGNLLHTIVWLFVTFFFFVLINFLLSSLVQNMHLSFIKLMNVLVESNKLLLSDGILSTVYFAYQHSFALFLTVVAIGCAYKFGLALTTLVNGECERDKEKAVFDEDNRDFNTETTDNTVSYRYKVCFLS